MTRGETAIERVSQAAKRRGADVAAQPRTRRHAVRIDTGCHFVGKSPCRTCKAEETLDITRWTIAPVLPALLILALAGCDGGGETATDDGVRTDAVADAPTPDPGPADPGPADPGPGDPGAGDPGTEDPGAPPADVPVDPGEPDASPSDPGPVPDTAPLDPGPTDGTEDSGPGSDIPAEEWPPSEPWWGTKVCKLPACDAGAPAGIDLSGLWTQTLTARSHDCNVVVETLKPEIKPGAVTTKKDQTFTVQGTCAYDKPGGTVTGVLKGDTMINCIVMPPEQGVTAMPSGWITFDGGTGAGKSTVRLYGIPVLKPTDCTVEYDVAYTRQ